MKNFLLLLFFSLSINISFLGLVYSAPLNNETSYNNEIAKAKIYVDNLSSKIIGILTSKEPKNVKETTLKTIFLENLDVETMTKYCLGRKYLTLTSDEKSRFTEVYKIYLINLYSGNMRYYISDYRGQTMTIKEITPFQNNQKLAVSTILKDGENTKKNITYILNNASGTLKIIDLIWDGISILNTQRDSFSRTLNGPGGLNNLIKELEAINK